MSEPEEPPSELREPPAEPEEPPWLPWVLEALQVMLRPPHRIDWAERFAAHVGQTSGVVQAGP
jgi:hypothetical protein